MGLSPDVNAPLRALSAAGGSDHDLVVGLQQLLETACRAAPSCLGVSLSVVRGLTPVTLVALSAIAADQPVLSSLAVRLPTPASAAVAATSHSLILYAAKERAFVSMAADLLALLDLDPRRVMFDGHLELPPADSAADMLSGQLDDLTLIGQALGVLLDKGLPTAAGWLQLEQLAAAQTFDVPGAAALVLAAARRRQPQDHPDPPADRRVHLPRFGELQGHA